MNTLNKNYLSSAAFYVFLMHSVSGSLSINISFTYWDWMGALRHSVLFIIQIGHLIPDPRSFPQRWELSFQHHKITAWSCIAVFFFITRSFSFSTTTLHLDFLNGCLPLCSEDQFRLHFQLLLSTCRTFNLISPLPPFPQTVLKYLFLWKSFFSLNDQKQR